jgi:(p)ppGpp synthase/HD superfamily hydrolase
MLTERLAAAFAYALELHQNQYRKGSEIPYISHLMGVCALVLEGGGDEDQAVAALLHDAVEDQGGMATLDEIRARFGGRVAYIVEMCSDAYGIPKPPWQERKNGYLEHLERAPDEVLLVSLADKIHNARTILEDLRREGNRTFARFKGGRTGTLWYYRSLAEVFTRRYASVLLPEFLRLVEEMERLSAELGEAG